MSTFLEFLKIQVQRIQKNENVVHSITPHFKFSLFSVLTHCICSCKITHPNHFKILEFIGEMMLDRNNKECIFHKLVVFFFSPKDKACNFIIHLGLATGNYIFKINNRIYKFIQVLNNCFQQLLTTLFSSKTSNKSLLSEGLT